MATAEAESIPVADCMSQLIDIKTGKDDPSLNLQIADVTLNAANIDWNQIRWMNMNDPTIVRLVRIIQQGWPDSSKELTDDIKVYFPYRFELHIVNGILFLQDRIVIPIGLRWLFLSKIHDSHLGIVKSKLLGRTLIY